MPDLPGLRLGDVGMEAVVGGQALRRPTRLGGKWVHVGRVNSWRRLDLVASWNVDSVDGTYLAFASQLNGRRGYGACTASPPIVNFDSFATQSGVLPR